MSEHHIDFPADTKQNNTPLGTLISQSYRDEALKKKKAHQRKKLALGFLSLILIGLTCFGFFYPSTRDYLGKLLCKSSSDGIPDKEWQLRYDAKKELLLRTGTEAKWSGPSVFKTDAQNFGLYVGGGKLSGFVQVLHEPIDQVELRISGKVFFQDGKTKQVDLPVHDDFLNKKKEYVHQGLRIIIEKTTTKFDAQITLEEEGEDGNGHWWPVSALLEFKIVFPENYRSYKSLSIETNPDKDESLDVFLLDDLNIEFTDLGLQAYDGAVLARASLIANNLVTYSKWNTKVSKVKPGEGEVISITSKTDTGSLSINALTTVVRDPKTKSNKLTLNSKNGKVEFLVLPEPNLKTGSRIGFAPVKIDAYSRGGAIDSAVTLGDKSQVLSFTAESVEQYVQATVSDNYSGSLDLLSKTKEVDVVAKKDSESEIKYEQETSSRVVATKTFPSSPEVGDGQITFSSKNGDIWLLFE